jgi:hypothetical protein
MINVQLVAAVRFWQAITTCNVFVNARSVKTSMRIKVGVPEAPDWFRERSRFIIIYGHHRRKWRIARIRSLCDYYRIDESLFGSSNKIIPRVRENGWIHVSSLLFAVIFRLKPEYSYLSPLSLRFEFAFHRHFIADLFLSHLRKSGSKKGRTQTRNVTKCRQMKLNLFARLTSGKWDTKSFNFLQEHIESHVYIACIYMHAS